jgi:hypothetical protein
MTAHAAPSARAAQNSKTADIPRARPVYDEFEYDSEAETLFGSESDGDGDAHPASANYQPAAGHGAARRHSANEPGAPPQRNIDTVVCVQKAEETEDAVHRSGSLIAGASRKAV